MGKLRNTSFKTAIIILTYLASLSITITPITVYNNAQFEPIDTRFMLSRLSSISSVNACLCECYNNIICFTATYFGINQTCLLSFAQLSQGQLRVVPTIVEATVYSFGNRSFGGLRIFQRTSETVYPIWNTTASSNSSIAVSSYYDTDSYWPTEPPENAFDNNLTSAYTNQGNCNSSMSTESITCGTDTGFYLTLDTGFIILIGFYFGTNTYSDSSRDPLTITIEGSNLNGSALTLGSSWTLIYNGTSGLLSDPGRSAWGTLQILPKFSLSFQSFRLLVTSKGGVGTCTSYSEFAPIIH